MDNQPKLLINIDKKGDVLIGNCEEDIEDDLSYDEVMSQEILCSLTDGRS